METNQGLQRWEDIVFENRNKSYGAYAIRKGYNDKVLRAGMVSIAVLAIILFLPGPSPKQIRDAIVGDTGPKLQTIDQKDIIIERQEQKPSPKPKSTGFAFTPTKEAIPDDSVAGTSNVPATTDIDPNAKDPGTEPSSTGPDVVEVPPNEGPEYVMGAEVMPSYEGGISEMMKFLKNKLRYPSRPSRQGIEGTVYVSFVVGKDGSIGYVEVIRGIDESDREAVRVISMMSGWKSGMQNKMPVAVKMVLPIKFSLGR